MSEYQLKPPLCPHCKQPAKLANSDYCHQMYWQCPTKEEIVLEPEQDSVMSKVNSVLWAHGAIYATVPMND